MAFTVYLVLEPIDILTNFNINTTSIQGMAKIGTFDWIVGHEGLRKYFDNSVTGLVGEKQRHTVTFRCLK